VFWNFGRVVLGVEEDLLFIMVCLFIISICLFMRTYTNMNIWIRSVEFVSDIYKCTKSLPFDEKYGLSSQIKRSAVSIPSNIAEGCRGSDKEFRQFLTIALGSGFELKTQLTILKNLKLIEVQTFMSLDKELEEILKMISSFRSSIKV
jgi:four helix bundle protein